MQFPMPIFGFTAVFKHGARQAWGMQVLMRALSAAALSHKEAAAIAGLTEPQFSRQCSGADGSHFSYPRIFEYPAVVIAALGKELYEEFSEGGVCVEGKQLQRLIEMSARVAAAMSQREQLRMELPETKEERRTA